ncbi:MAG: hypothetical protein JWQ50_6873 [Caballeronia mineralivorans]|jgi:hypothetical protein|nr:hypothetical protein [Caballeronia mineralivorans]
MESFARAVEIVLKDSELRDARGYPIESMSSFLRRNIAAPNVLHRTRMFSGRLPERGR